MFLWIEPTWCANFLNLLKPICYVMHHQFNIQQLYALPTLYVFCIYLRTNSDLCHLQHKLIGFYNRNERCLQRGTDWVFEWSSLRFVLKRLICFCFSLYVSGNYVPIIRRKLTYLCDTWFFSLYVGDCLVCRAGRNSFRPAYQTTIYIEWQIPVVA